MLYYLTAVTIGLMGSLHCVGMCGPIAMAVPLSNESKGYRFLGSFNYLFGKALTYSLLGLFSGAFARMIELTGFQRYMSLFTGLLILLIFILQRFGNGTFGLERLNYQWVALLKQQFNKFLNEKNLVSAFLIGLVNGVLPCGLVYIALAGAVGAGGWWQSMLYMFLFGVATMPLMFVLMIFKSKLSLSFKGLFQKAIPAFTVILAVLLIVRGLNIGIPYFSPKVNIVKEKTSIECCSKPITKSN
jgi:sulfite exporter TauE/SafE